MRKPGSLFGPPCDCAPGWGFWCEHMNRIGWEALIVGILFFAVVCGVAELCVWQGWHL